MRLVITGRGVDLTPALRQMIEQKIDKLERILNDSVVSVQVVIAQERYRRLVEIVVHARGDHTLHGQGDATTWPLSMKQAIEKITQQAHRLKEKWASRKRRAAGTKALPIAGPSTAVAAPASPKLATAARRTTTATPAAPRIIRASRYVISAMSAEDAALKVEAGDALFVVFRNAATDSVNILYRRKDGNFGLIDPE